jgi:hypothetical protein
MPAALRIQVIPAEVTRSTQDTGDTRRSNIDESRIRRTENRQNVIPHDLCKPCAPALYYTALLQHLVTLLLQEVLEEPRMREHVSRPTRAPLPRTTAQALY